MNDWIDSIIPLLRSEFGSQWFQAFVTTQLVEIPLYLRGARKLPAGKRWLFAAGASSLTHPFLWFAIPWESIAWEPVDYWPTVILAECNIVLIEGVFGKSLGVPHPFFWSLTANSASVLTGILLSRM